MKLVPIDQIWRGNLPTTSGWNSNGFGWVKQLINIELLGSSPHSLKSILMILKLMLRRLDFLDIK